ncbi:MAG: AtpZ/AtpI family protein [Acidobacteriota bacterium]
MVDRPTKQAGEALRTIGALSTVGLSFVLAIVIGVWIGQMLDRWLGTKPLFFFVFFCLGLVAGILNVYRTVSRVMSNPPTSTRPPGLGPADLHTPPLDDAPERDLYKSDR